MEEGVAKGSRLASAVAAARSGVWETASRCAGRVVSLSWFLRWALSIRAGPDSPRHELDDGAPPAVSQASPCKASGARYRGAEAGTSLKKQLLE